MGIIPEDWQLPNRNFLKAKHFDGEGLELQVQSFDKHKPENVEFGAGEDNVYVKNGILEADETFRFVFKKEGSIYEYVYDTASKSFVSAFQSADINPEEVVHIKAEGSGKTRKYVIAKRA